MSMDAQLAAGLGYSPISSFYCLPSRLLGGRFDKTPPFGEPLHPNRMSSDVMDHPIRFIYY
jgi:hypothetical protein